MTDPVANTYQCLSADEAAVLIRGVAPVTIFDVRDMASYQRGHVAEAAQLSEDRLGGWLRRLPKEQAIVIYCFHGNASKVFAQMFVDFRFTRVVSVNGGYEPLVAALAGLPA